MRLVIESQNLKIVSESAQDEAYIRDTLGLYLDGDAIALVRRDPWEQKAVCLETEGGRIREETDSDLKTDQQEDGL